MLVALLSLILTDVQIAGNPSVGLSPFAPLIGQNWVSEFPDGKVTDTQRFEWVYGQQFVRNTHQVRTPDGRVVYEGETIYAWDAPRQEIVWWYWNSTGGYVTGTVAVRPDGALIAEGENHAPGNQLSRTRVVIRILGGSWTLEGAQERSGTWTQQPLRTYKIAK
jgi:hypothetical protein